MNPLADEPRAYPITERRTIHEGYVWDVVGETVETEHGELRREFVDHPGAVAVLALDDDDNALVIQQYRHPVRARLWELPAGLLDIAGEAPHIAAVRELGEETDLTCSELHVLADFYPSPGGLSESLRIYLARGITELPAEALSPREHEEAGIETRWVDLDELVDAALSGRLTNATLLIGVLAAAQSRRQGWASLREATADWPSRRLPGR